MKKKPLTIENRWDILYRDYPEVYHEFASVPYNPHLFDVLLKHFDFKNKVVADVGSGSGLSSIKIAQVAKKVIGIEIEDSMRALAEKEAAKLGINNVEFVAGDGRNIPLDKDSVDIVTGITLAIHPVDGYRDFVRSASEIVKGGGLIIMLNITPGWYGGELSTVIVDKGTGDQKLDKILVDEFGFKRKDFYSVQEYGSLNKIISTYGFIFGKKVIDFLKKNNKTSIKWKFRIHYKKVNK
jgi:ubiquinone/menaquinone biosynthesis C-methylase UbiE